MRRRLRGYGSATCLRTCLRHCEPTGRANARPMTGSAKQSIARAVIASEAKQSIAPRKERMDCFAALAMTSKRAFALATRSARGVDETFAPQRAGGTPDARCTRG